MCTWMTRMGAPEDKLIRFSFVEDKLETNAIFDAKGLLEKSPSHNGRLRYWNNELCAKKPQTFDIVLAV